MMPLMEIVLDNGQPTFNLSLILAIVWIIQNDFAVYSTSALTVGQYAITVPSRNYQNDLLDEVLRRTLNPHANIKFLLEDEMFVNGLSKETLTTDQLQEMFFKHYANQERSIWLLDSLEAYKKFEKNLLAPNRHIHRNGYFLIVYTGMERGRLANVKEIFRRLFNIYVININVLMMVGKYPFAYTYFPFAPNQCHSSQPAFFLSFRGIASNPNFTLNKGLYPVKVANMHGCVLTVVTWTVPPYIYVDRNETTGDLFLLHGIEGSLITLMSQKMNFTIVIKEPELKKRDDIYPNGTTTGATKMILDGKANISLLSYLYTKERSDIMQASKSYLTLPFILIVPQGKKMTPFERLLKPFRYIIWSCFSSSFLFGIILIYYLRFLGRSKMMNFVYGQGNRIPFTNLLLTLFGGSIHNNLPYRNFARFLLAVWVLYTLVLRSAYSGELFIILQDGSSRSNLKNLQEVVDKKYTIYAFAEMETVIKFTSPQANTRVIGGQNFVPSLFKRIGDPNSPEKIALCLPEYSIIAYNQMHPTRPVERLQQPLITPPIVFYMPPHSYLLHHTSDLILRILQAGLMQRFKNVYFYTSQKPPRSEPVKLSFEVLLGLFCVYAAFILLGIFVLILEICSQKSLRIKKCIDFLNL